MSRPQKYFYNFIIYDPTTNLPIYTRYNFNFNQYNIDYKLNIPKSPSFEYNVFTDFFFRAGFEWSKPYVMPPQFIKYFSPITNKILEYIEYYGFSFHYGYLSAVVPTSFVQYGDLRRAQCDLVYYDEKQVRRLQDYYFDDSIMLYTKYNFDFYNYAKDFNLYGNELLIFTDFTIRCTNLSNVLNTSASYGIVEQFKKYFYMYSRDNLVKYITYNGVNSVLNKDYKNLNNIDFSKFIDVNPKLKGIVDPVYAKEFYIRTGQFDFYNIPFYYNPPTIYDTLKASCCVVTTTNSDNTAAGFLSLMQTDVNSIYLVTCYHILGNSKNNLYVYADFQLNQPDTYTSTTTRAQFKIVGFDRRSDILLAVFDPTLSYNIINGITNLDNYPSLTIDLLKNVTESDNIFTIGNIGLNNYLSLNFSQIIDNNYSGLSTEISRPPSYLISSSLPVGSSGGPLFSQNLDGSVSLIGMINSKIPSTNYSVAINGYFLSNIVEVMVSQYYYYSVKYANDLIRYNNSIKYGFTTVWLGIDGDYWTPESKTSIKQLSNLNYTGGVLITNFILGFNSSTNERIYNAEDLNKKEIFVLNGPLLNSNMYKKFLQSGNVPIVLVSVSYFDSIYSNYVLRTFGKFSNQVAYSYYLYGFQSIGTYEIIDSPYTNSVYFEYPQLTLTYYYYDGSNWILTSEVIGGNDDSWYTIYTDNYGNKFYQHKFEFPTILLDYVEYFMSQINSPGNLGGYDKTTTNGYVSYTDAQIQAGNLTVTSAQNGYYSISGKGGGYRYNASI
jgi:hypothetical protein